MTISARRERERSEIPRRDRRNSIRGGGERGKERRGEEEASNLDTLRSFDTRFSETAMRDPISFETTTVVLRVSLVFLAAPYSLSLDELSGDDKFGIAELKRNEHVPFARDRNFECKLFGESPKNLESNLDQLRADDHSLKLARTEQATFLRRRDRSVCLFHSKSVPPSLRGSRSRIIESILVPWLGQNSTRARDGIISDRMLDRVPLTIARDRWNNLGAGFTAWNGIADRGVTGRGRFRTEDKTTAGPSSREQLARNRSCG